MRDIKFRAWSTSTKVMYMMPAEKGGGNLFDLKEHETWKVMQYTGLKDKNGKEIYEDDVLQHPESKEVFIVKWSDAYSGFRAMYQNDEVYNGATLTLQINDKGQAIVIGNIYENPELLNNKQNKGE